MSNGLELRVPDIAVAADVVGGDTTSVVPVAKPLSAGASGAQVTSIASLIQQVRGVGRKEK